MPKGIKSIAGSAFMNCNSGLNIIYAGSPLQWNAIVTPDLDCHVDPHGGPGLLFEFYLQSDQIQYEKKTNLKDCTKPSIPDQIWTGKAIRTSARPVAGTNGFAQATTKVSYKNNKNVGTATVTYKGTGNFTGTMKASFRILPKGTKLRSVAARHKSLAVKWQKQTKQTDGYQIRCYEHEKGMYTSHKYKLFTVKGNTKAEKLCAGLKSNQTYYVRIRTFKNVKGKRYYAPWSDAVVTTTK